MGEAVRTPRDAAIADLRADGIEGARVKTQAFVRMRYLGQALELEVPLSKSFRRAFDEEHERLLHTADRDRAVEATGLRVTATGDAEDTASRRYGRRTSRRRRVRPPAAIEVYCDGKFRRTGLYDRAALDPGSCVTGPAVVTEYSSTHLVAGGWEAEVDGEANLRLRAHG